MSQLNTLFWLRYRIFKNSLMTRGELGRKILNWLLLLIPTLLSIGIGVALVWLLVFVEQAREPVMNGGMTKFLSSSRDSMTMQRKLGRTSTCFVSPASDRTVK